MGKYRITAARPKDADHHLNTEFKVFELQQKPDKTWKWRFVGWKSIYAVSALLDNGNEVRTGKVTTSGDETIMTDGAAVELELRIAKNDTKFKISDMPDK